jgi:hypothetical protein
VHSASRVHRLVDARDDLHELGDIAVLQEQVEEGMQ